MSLDGASEMVKIGTFTDVVFLWADLIQMKKPFTRFSRQVRSWISSTGWEVHLKLSVGDAGCYWFCSEVWQHSSTFRILTESRERHYLLQGMPSFSIAKTMVLVFICLLQILGLYFTKGSSSLQRIYQCGASYRDVNKPFRMQINARWKAQIVLWR